MYERIIAELLAAGIRFVVIGGVAAVVHGSARMTNDIDICYDPAPENVDRLAGLLREWRAYLRGVEPGLPFILDARTFRTTPVMTLTTALGDVDVMDAVAGLGSYERVVAASEPATIGATTFRTLTLPALIAAKRAAGRPRDFEHLIELEALLALRQERSNDR
jgi:predicted nucleotidyltransferase